MTKYPTFSGKYSCGSEGKEMIRNYINRKRKFSLKSQNLLLKSITRQTLMKISDISQDISTLELLLHSTTIDIDWEQVSKEVKLCPKVCEWEWKNRKFPLLNFKDFSKKELEMLESQAKKFHERNWIKITQELQNNRVVWHVYRTFIKKIKRVNLTGRWTKQEDLKLEKAVKELGQEWTRVAYYLPNRSPAQCLQRWNFSLHPGIKKGRWSKEEDSQLLKGIQEFGKKWNKIRVTGRTDAQIRERYENVLNPEINRGPWTEEEREILRDLVQKIGPKWSIISQQLPNRTDNMCIREWKRMKI